MAETDDIILAQLLHIRAVIDCMRNDDREMMQPAGKLECHYANMSDRLDRGDVCIERIEHRVGLTDA
jgi:hypothetical protein